MGFFDSVKKTGLDLKTNHEIQKKIQDGIELTEEEKTFFLTKNPDKTISQVKQEFDDKQTLKKHKLHKIGTFTDRVKFFEDEKGMYYFTAKKELNPEEKYYLVDFQWGGPQYQAVSTTTTTGKDKQQGRSGSAIAGGLLGTVLAPGVGTVIGAAAGGSRKKKTDINRKSKTTTEQVEQATPASLIFIKYGDEKGEKLFLNFSCDSTAASLAKDLTYTSENSIYPTNDDSSNSGFFSAADEILKFKELLDQGIITQEEFDLKKKELLGI